MRTSPSQPISWNAPDRQRGFTIIELMIVVACVAILAAIAFPNYNEYMLRARRTDAKNALLELAGRQERFYSMNNRYAKTATELGYSALPMAVHNSGRSYYQLSVDFSGDGKSYSAKAEPQGTQTRDRKCYAYTLTHTGAHGNIDDRAEPLSSAPCW